MPETLIKVDLTKSAYDNDMVHNRWHPDVPIVAWVNPGDDFVIETYDWTGGFIKNNESADDVRDIDLTIVHFLYGPGEVQGGEQQALRCPSLSTAICVKCDIAHYRNVPPFAPRARRQLRGLDTSRPDRLPAR